jgi:hypothetical protein
MFRNPSFYKKKYNHIYLFTPEGSFKSVVNHPFRDHDKIFHDLHEDDLYDIEDELLAIKEECLEEDFELEHSVCHNRRFCVRFKG